MKKIIPFILFIIVTTYASTINKTNPRLKFHSDPDLSDLGSKLSSAVTNISGRRRNININSESKKSPNLDSKNSPDSEFRKNNDTREVKNPSTNLSSEVRGTSLAHKEKEKKVANKPHNATNQKISSARKSASSSISQRLTKPVDSPSKIYSSDSEDERKSLSHLLRETKKSRESRSKTKTFKSAISSKAESNNSHKLGRSSGSNNSNKALKSTANDVMSSDVLEEISSNAYTGKTKKLENVYSEVSESSKTINTKKNENYKKSNFDLSESGMKMKSISSLLAGSPKSSSLERNDLYHPSDQQVQNSLETKKNEDKIQRKLADLQLVESSERKFTPAINNKNTSSLKIKDDSTFENPIEIKNHKSAKRSGSPIANSSNSKKSHSKKRHENFSSLSKTADESENSHSGFPEHSKKNSKPDEEDSTSITKLSSNKFYANTIKPSLSTNTEKQKRKYSYKRDSKLNDKSLNRAFPVDPATSHQSEKPIRLMKESSSEIKRSSTDRGNLQSQSSDKIENNILPTNEISQQFQQSDKVHPSSGPYLKNNSSNITNLNNARIQVAKSSSDSTMGKLNRTTGILSKQLEMEYVSDSEKHSKNPTQIDCLSLMFQNIPDHEKRKKFVANFLDTGNTNDKNSAAASSNANEFLTFEKLQSRENLTMGSDNVSGNFKDAGKVNDFCSNRMGLDINRKSSTLNPISNANDLAKLHKGKQIQGSTKFRGNSEDAESSKNLRNDQKELHIAKKILNSLTLEKLQNDEKTQILRPSEGDSDKQRLAASVKRELNPASRTYILQENIPKKNPIEDFSFYTRTQYDAVYSMFKIDSLILAFAMNGLARHTGKIFPNKFNSAYEFLISEEGMPIFLNEIEKYFKLDVRNLISDSLF